MKKQQRTKTMKRMLCLVILIALCTEIGSPSRTKAADLSGLSENHFSLIQKKQLSDGNEVYYMEHNSGARVVYTDNKSEDKMFGIGFCTPDLENNDAAHVLEHAVLSGSELYPSRDIFNYMTTTSVATELNGYTRKDYTVFPFSTRNKKDYENLLSVYLSSIFRPMFLKEEKIFKRDGIRKEYRDGKVYYNGIVYNENKGNNIVDVEEQLTNQLYNELYKGTNLQYGSHSVDGLKTLTYQDIIKTYQKYYTTSNCLVYLSGNVDLKFTLQQLDEYFTKYGKRGEKVTVQTAPVPTNKSLETEYSAEKADNTYSAGIISSGARMTDQKERKTSEIIFNYLSKNLASSNCIVIGDDNFYYTMGFLLQKVSKNDAEQFLKKYEKIIADLEKNGLSSQDVESAVSALNNSANSDSLGKIYSAMEGFTYGNNPLLLLDYNASDESLIKEDSSYFSDFVKNIYKKCQVEILSHGKTEIIEKSFDEVTGNINLEQIKKETEEYNKWIETEESETILSKNPILERKDFETVEHDFSSTKETKNGITYIYSKTNTPDSFSFTLSFELSALGTAKEIREAQLFCNLINLSLQEQGINNISCILQAYESSVTADSYKPVFEIWGNGKKEKLAETMQSVQKYILNNTTIFSKSNFNKNLNTIKKSVNTAQENYRVARLSEISAMLSNVGKYRSIAFGLSGEGSSSYGAWLNTQKEAQYNTLIREIKQVKNKVFNKNNISITLKGSSKLFTNLKEETKKLTSVLEQKKYKKIAASLPKMPYQSTAYLTNEKESIGEFIQLGSLVSKKTPVDGSMRVLANYLTSAYVKPKMRGIGAYGAEFTVTPNGGFKINVTRVSDVKGALKQLKGIGAFLKNTKLTQKELDANIIKVINDLDNTYLYSEFSVSDFYHHGFTKETYLKLRKEILSTTVKDIKAYADVLDKAIAKNYINAVGNKAFIDSFTFTFKKVNKVK